MDRADQGDLLNLLKERLGFKKLSGPFPRKETVAEMLGAVVNKDLSWIFSSPDYPQFLEQRDHLAKMAAPTRTKSAATPCWTNDDLLLEGRRLLIEHEDVRRHLSNRFRYLMVDEYQDTNRLQAELVQLLAYSIRTSWPWGRLPVHLFF